MARLRQLALAVAVGGIMAGCGSGTTGESDLPNVTGVWSITKFEFVSVANPATKSDQAAGANATLTMTSTAWTIAAGGSNQFNGTYTRTATTMTVTGTDSGGNSETFTFTLALSGSTLTLTGASTTHNFGSGEVAALLNVTATKQ